MNLRISKVLKNQFLDLGTNFTLGNLCLTEVQKPWKETKMGMEVNWFGRVPRYKMPRQENKPAEELYIERDWSLHQGGGCRNKPKFNF